MDMQVAERLMTADELMNLDISDHIKVELVQGVLVTMPPANTPHSMISSYLIILIGSFDLQHRLGGRVTGEQGGYQFTRNPDTVRAPDVGYISKERIALQQSNTYFPGAPDLAVEVVSGESASDLQDKVDEYFAYGARLVWTVFPKSKSIHVHSPTHIDILKGDDLLKGGDVLPNFSHPVSDIFSVLEADS
jgi:Uma2 family endonuclease